MAHIFNIKDVAKPTVIRGLDGLENMRPVPPNDSTEITYDDIDSDKILAAALGKYKSVVIIGRDMEDELHVCTSDGDIRHIVYDIEWAKMIIMRDNPEDDEDA